MKHALLLALGLLVASGIARGTEDVHSHANAPHKTIVLDNDRISPEALTMGEDDVLQFENYAPDPMTVLFVEPKEQPGKIHCHLIDAKHEGASKAPWLLFDWNPKQQLTATIPPGRFASLCSLAPGEYVFVTKPATRAVSGSAEGLGMKGTITVR